MNINTMNNGKECETLKERKFVVCEQRFVLTQMLRNAGYHNIFMTL